MMLFACHPPAAVDNCLDLPIDGSLPNAEICEILSDGDPKEQDSTVFLSNTEEMVSFEFEDTGADSFIIRLLLQSGASYYQILRHPVAHFTFLPGGQHEIEYWAIKNGKSSKHQFRTIIVEEAMTEKNWFYPLLVTYILLLLGTIAYFWSLYNIRQKLKLQHVRSRMAADLHDEVSSDLSSAIISMTTLERIKQDDPVGYSELLQDIKQTLTETQNNLLDTVWAIKPEKDTGTELFQRMKKFAEKIFPSNRPELILKNDIPSEYPVKLSMEQRHNVFKMYKEALHNISKHANATHVEIHFRAKQKEIEIEIKDNGIGFDPAASYDGNGLSNYYERAKEGCIIFELKSKPGEGCQIKMIIPEL